MIKASQNIPARLTSLDAYRGLVMLLMMAEVLRFCDVSAALPESGWWRFLCQQQSHAEWIGCTLHDLIQPSFSFLVGVALPFSLAARRSRGQSSARMAGHAAWRSLVLILLGVFLRSVGQRETYWTFEDTLTQIGLGYFFLYLIAWQSVRMQWIVLGLILVGYWTAFALYPLPAASVDAGLTGFAAHWNKNTNLAWAFDTWFLNLFPRSQPFQFNEGGYVTLSFIPTLATMIMGLIAGAILRSDQSPKHKITWLAGAGLILLLAGSALGWAGMCPVVKRIWTPSWVLFSGGWCCLLLAAFYGGLDVAGGKKWAMPLTVIGMNSIAAYCMAHLFEGFIGRTLTTHLGAATFDVFGAAYEPLVLGSAILTVLWLILWWMHRRQIYLRV